MFGRTMSEGNRCLPVTKSRNVGLGTDVPITFHSFTGVRVTLDWMLCLKVSTCPSIWPSPHR